MKNNLNLTIGEIVANDFRAAAIFSKYKIDFCCKGNRSIEDACEKKSINPDEIINELNTLSNESDGIDYNSWPLDLLSDYIEKTHHEYIREKTPPLMQFLEKVQKVHGEANPELYKIFDLFSNSAEDLLGHLKKEEMILFPFIRKMIEAEKENNNLENPHFGTVENPIAMMEDDHSEEGERFRKISELSNEYTPPAHACNTYKVTFAMLEDFEKNLHRHIHLENNILFPKAILLEKKLRQKEHSLS